jgi:hypothetical protein
MDEHALNAEIERAARALRERWDSPDLLDRIQAAVAADSGAAAGESQPVFREEDDAEYRGARVIEFRSRVMRALAIAASLAFLIAMGAVAATILGMRGERGQFDRWVLEEAALLEVEKNQKAHMDSIDRLAKLVEPKLEDASSPLALSYREKLMLLDQAIAECEAEIDVNRKNSHVRKQLIAVYSEKQRTLQQLMQENLNAQ